MADLVRCTEAVPCGGAVWNDAKGRRQHRQWHDRVFIAERAERTAPSPRYVGMDDDPDVGTGGVGQDMTQRDVAPLGDAHAPGGDPSA